ncbi:MAG: hypothetical protein AB1505_05835 [Candidatus Latescibacterota bacterium]
MSAGYAALVDARLQQIAAAMAQRGARSLWGAHALLLTGTATPEVLLDVVRRGLRADARGPDGRLRAGPFEVLPAALLLRRWRDALPAAAVDLIGELMTWGVQERGNTENHWLMYYAGNLLAAEAWPHEETWWNGLPPGAMQAEASRWILETIARTARWGHHEYDSPQYHAEHLIPLIGVADHAADPQLRHQAAQAATLLVADMALEYFHGAWAGGHSREGYRQNTWTRVGPIQGLQYAYFGGVEFDAELHANAYIAPTLASPYRPPEVLAALANDRAEPRVVRKSRAPRTLYRHVEREPLPVRKYTYLSRSFALGSTRVGLPGPPTGPIDLVSWDLTWDGPQHQAKVVANHPFRGAGRFSAFLSELPQAARRSVASGKPYLQFADRLFGASPYERLAQHEGLLVALYRIPEDDEAPYVNLYLPRAVAWAEQDGWLLGDVGSFCVAVYPVGAYHWEEVREADAASIMVTHGDLVDGWLLKLEGCHPGLVLEAAEAHDAGGFGAFVERRLGAGLDLGGWPREGRVRVQSLQGRWLDVTYDGEHLLDGAPIVYDPYPLYEAPGVTAEVNTGRMVFTHGDERVELDFGIDPEARAIPMRVIG